MSEICAYTSCDGSRFKHGLCKNHYAVIAEEALTGVKGESEASAPFLTTALYVFNRLTDSLIDKYRRAFEVKGEDLLHMHLEGVDKHVRSGAIDRATDSLERAARLAPDNTKITVSLGDLHLREGNYEEALACYRAVEPGHPQMDTKIGEALCGLGRYEEAVEHFEQALQGSPNSGEKYSRLGAALEASGALEEALAAYERASELEPDEPRYQQALGFGYEAIGRHEDALHCFKRALELER